VKQPGNPWMKFYPADWRSDPMLRLCSLAARGLWAEMICLMHEAEPYGSLLVNGKRIDRKQLSRLVGVAEKECTALMMELEVNGVFSRDPDGVIYSRRMRRDKAKADRDKVNGKGGGNPNLMASVNAGVNPQVKGQVKAQKPDARSQTPEKEGTRASALVLSGWPADFFEQFWEKYPNKVDKAGALKVLTKVGNKGAVPWQTIMDGLNRYIAKTDDRPWCNPTTWINQARWEEQHATARPNNGFRIGNTRRTGHDAILASATRKARKFDQQDGLARSENQIEPASQIDAHNDRTRGDGTAFGGDQGNHHGLEFDPGGVLEGEIIAPDKNASRVPDSGQLI
jgi:hypothetical protein